MKFYTRQKRQPAVIILSLIDILAILLIFFIVTTTFRKTQPQLKINLPESRTAELAPAEQREPILLEVRSEEEIMLNGRAVALDALAPTLKAAREAEPTRPLALQADREAPFGLVVKVLDALQEAGIRNIPAFTQPRERP
ncbi:MAG: biopolymer transporter ExbD [Terrimicrobiaceae bacterium]|nr:biopolymer transporter ExbD [Terrimicrobiaceae bacterium]